MEKFGKFQLLESIGKGGMAEIFLARPSDAALSKLVALKRILPEYAKLPAFRDMFRREGEIALRFRHPSIATVYEMGMVDDVYYMTMELFPGKTLAELISTLRENKDAFDIPCKISIIKSIAEALHYIHEFSDHGGLTEIIHRDISPQNILVGYDGATKLIDFGVARVNTAEEATGSQDLKGKVAYMSPEQVRGDALTKQTDIFSLGIVLWEVLAGKKLFTGTSVEEVSRRVEACQIPSLALLAPELPVELVNICQVALANDVRTRYESAGALASELDYVLIKYFRNRNPKLMSQVLQRLYPEDVTRLRALFKKHEIVDRSSPRADASKPAKGSENSTPARAEVPNAPPAFDLNLNQQKSLKKNSGIDSKSASAVGKSAPSQRIAKPATAEETLSGGWKLVIVCCGLAFGLVIFGIQNKMYLVKSLPIFQRESVITAEEPPAQVANVAPATSASVPLPAHAIERPAGPAKMVAEMPAPAVAPSAPAASPKLVTTTVPASVPSSTSAPALPTAPLPVAVNPPKSPPRPSKPADLAAKKLAHAQRTAVHVQASPRIKTPERKIASQAPTPIKAFAYLTILADPEAQILVDGKVVGTEVVNSLKVPANHLLVVKVILKSGTERKAQKLTLKAYSRNVVEFSDQTDEPSHDAP